MAIPKTKEQYYNGLSDNAKWLLKLQQQEGNSGFNEMIGNVERVITGDLDNDWSGGWSHFTTQYRDSGATGTASDAANQVWEWIQNNGDASFKPIMDEVRNYNNSIKKLNFYNKNIKDIDGIDTPLTRGFQEFMTSADEKQEYEKRLNEINSMKAAYLSGQTRAIANNFAQQERRVLETHRRYGITGAAAQANLEDLQLKKSQALADMQSKAALELNKNFRSETMQLNAMKDKITQGAKNNILKAIAGGQYSDVASVKKALANAGIRHALDDNDIASAIKNPDSIKDLIKTIV